MNNQSNGSGPSQTIEQAKDYVQATIQDLTTTLSQSRQKLQELQLSFNEQPNQQTGQNIKGQVIQSASGQVKKNLDLVDLAKLQVHHIINEYFKYVSDNYILLQSKYPNKELKNDVIKQIDNTLVELNVYSQKMNTKQFGISDYQEFKSVDYQRVQLEVIQEAQNLENRTKNVQNAQRLTQDSLPQVKINNRVVEGLYLALNEYASNSWLGDLPKETYEQPSFTMASFYTKTQIMPITVIDDEKSSFGYFNIADGTNSTQKYTFALNDSLQYQSTTIMTPQGQIYIMGGVSPQGQIVDQVHVLDPQKNTITKLAQMSVKRVGCSACYVPSQQPGSKGFIYVFGGRTNHMVKTKLCEVYDIDRNKWQDIPKMLNGKARPACCYDSVRNDIYLFFGTDSNAQNLNVIERYNLISKTWQTIEISNFLPGFDITLGCALQINPDLIMVFGGMRDSLYFKEQMYFNRKVMLFNITNNSFLVTDWSLPVDFLPIMNPIIQDGKVYSIGMNTQSFMKGTFLKSNDEQPQMFLDGAFVIVFDQIVGPKVVSYVQAYEK